MTAVPDDLAPWWLERQRDAAGPDFEAGRGALNVTHRDWVELGTLGSGGRAVVDPRGGVAPGDGSWSLDWWVGAEDRWHLPSREVAVRQRRPDGPVVETTMRVPGGDVVHRAFAVQAEHGPAVVVEVANETPAPVAVALVVVPYGPTGLGSVRTVECSGDTVVVDGRPAVRLPRRPGRLAGGCADAVHRTVLGGGADEPRDPYRADCADDRAALALVYPVPHRTALRVLLPLDEPRGGAAPSPPARVPTIDELERGWRAHLDRAAPVVLPDSHLASALTAALGDLLVFHAGEDIVTWPGRVEPWPSAAVVLEALGQLGLAREVEQVLRGFPDEQRLDGAVVSPAEELAANGAVLRVAGRHWQLERDDALVDHLVGPVAKAGHWIDKRRTSRRRPLLARGRYLDALWSISGLRAVAPALRATGQPEVADDLVRFAARLEGDVDVALAGDEARCGRPVPPVAPGAPVGADAVANLAAARLDVWGPGDRRLAALVEHVRDRASTADLVVEADGWGLDPRATLELGLAELARGDDRCADRLYAVLARATPDRTWPEVIHPRTGGGSRGRGHDPVTAALFVLLVRALLVRERAAGLSLATVVPELWLGQPWEVRDLPTAHGRLGYAVRWHGERAALLWELRPHEPGAEVELTAPGLDPGWSTTRPSGEALLGPISPRTRPTGGVHPSGAGADPAEPASGGGAEASSSFT